MPATDSASWAVTAAIRVRTSDEATCESRWNQRVISDSRREDAERHEPQPPVEQEEAADRREERQRVDDERRQSLVEDVRERVDVARQARDDPARLLLREVAQRERRQVLEEVAAQLEHDPLADARQPSQVAVPSTQAAALIADVEDDVGHEPRLVAGAHAVVDRVPDQKPARHRRGGGERGEGITPHAPRRPRRTGSRRERPVCCPAYAATRLVSEEAREEAAGGEQLRRAAPARRHGRRRARRRGRRRRSSRGAGSRQHGAAGDGGAEVLDQVPFGLRVDGGHRVVEHEHARAREQRPRERDALALAAGEVDAALADQRVVAVREIVDERRRLRRRRTRRGRRLQSASGRAGEEVLAQQDREEDGPLRHEGDRGPQLGQRARRARRRRRRARAGRWGRRSGEAGSAATSCPRRSRRRRRRSRPAPQSRSTPRSTSAPVA